MHFTTTLIALLAGTGALAAAVPAAAGDSTTALDSILDFDDASFNTTAFDDGDDTPSGTKVNGPTLVARAGFARVTTWTGSGCTGGSQNNFYQGNQINRCLVRGGNAIQVSGDGGCRVATWSGNDCRGSTYNVPNANGQCRNVPYASVSIICS